MRTRVLVVDDSLTVRKRLVEVLTADPELEVVGEAADGKEAIDLCRRLRPDVITLDMMLPVMSGLAATEYIMAHVPTPILVVSSSTNRGELFKTYEALAAGAVDVLDKPAGDAEDHDWERRLLATVKLVSRIKVITHLRARLSRPPTHPGLGAVADEGRERPAASVPVGAPLVAIGASTGGPGAIVEVLRRIPADLPAPILVVLHLGRPFGDAFAEWLDGQTHHRVTTVDRLPPGADRLDALRGRVVMAPSDRHLVVRGGRVATDTSDARFSCRPSVDVLFESLAQGVDGAGGAAGVVACLLTGMGRDGAAGLLAIRHSGGHTIAQDEATSVVYGMPREAVLRGAAVDVLPLPEIGPAIHRLVSRRR